jgi:cytochrome c oxidase cbb3-type subunit I/II
MPNYPWLFKKGTDFKALPGKVAVQQRLGVPFPIMTPEEIEQHAREQALGIAEGLVGEKVKIITAKGEKEPTNATEARDHLAGKEIIALIAYLQKLGSFEEVEPKIEPVEPRIFKPGIPDNLRIQPDIPEPEVTEEEKPAETAAPVAVN